jgi:hypothetical protein
MCALLPMHDLESFFWVLFWICIYREGSTINDRIVLRFEKWWYMDNEELIDAKQEVVHDEDEFLRIAEENFTTYHKPLTPCLNRLRKAVFPRGEKRNGSDMRLYHDMQEILGEAQTDPRVRHEPEGRR